MSAVVVGLLVASLPITTADVVVLPLGDGLWSCGNAIPPLGFHEGQYFVFEGGLHFNPDAVLPIRMFQAVVSRLTTPWLLGFLCVGAIVAIGFDLKLRR